MATLVREIGYAPLPSQRKFHESKARYKLFSACVGAGKSKALVQECIRLAVINAGRLGLIGAPTYKILHDTTQREFFTVLEENQIPYKFNKSDKECVLLDTQSHIIFRTLDDPSKLVGTNLAWFGIDEMAYADEFAWLRLQARLRDPKAKQLAGFGATTPNGLNWVWDRFFGDKKIAGYDVIQAKPGENHFLPSDFYGTLALSYDQRFYRQEVLGEYLALQRGTAYHAYDQQRNVNDSIEFDPSAELCWSLDFNINPMSSVIAQIKDYAPNFLSTSRDTKKVEVLDEIVISAGTIELVCKTFVERTEKWRRGGRRLRVHVYGDASGNNGTHAGRSDYELIKQFFARDAGHDLIWRIPASNPSVRDRVNSVNASLLNAQQDVRLTVHPRCKVLITDLLRVEWASDSYGNLLSDLSKKHKDLTHISDALGYLIEREFSAARQTSGGFKNDTRLI